ncbi:MAG: pilus assembly protein PilM [Candidatus Komeilibacteria bacterium]|nr:pilus assembly protein PilM [Candidatus Komeilibacteria bacterium]
MFQQRQAFGINCSDSSLEALELAREHDYFVVKSQSRVELAGGIIENGKIIQPEKLKVAVQELLAQATPSALSGKEIALTLPESRSFVQTYVLPRAIGVKQVPSALFSEARETLPVESDLIVADFQKVGETDAGVRYLFAATYSELIREYTDFFSSLRLKVSLITMESIALGAATVDDSKEEMVLILDIGARTTIASVFQNGALQESINITIAGNHLTAALAEKLKLSIAEAEQRKITVGLKHADGDGAAMLIIQGQLQPLKDEIQLFMKFYEQRTRTVIARVILAGGTAALPGLDEYFADNLGLPTTVAEPLPLFHVSMERSDLERYIVVLGLARIATGSYHGVINFLEHSEKDWLPAKHGFKKGPEMHAQAPVKKKGSSKKMLIYLLLLGFAALAFLGIYWWRYGSTLGNIFPGGPRSADGTALPEQSLNFVINQHVAQQKTMSFVFTVATPSGTAETGDIPGSLEDATFETSDLSEITPPNTDPVALMSKQNGESGPSEAPLAQRLADYFADRLWEAQKNDQIVERGIRGRLVLGSYFKKSINTTDTNIRLEGDTVSPGSSLSVTYQMLTMPIPSPFQSIESARLKSFTAENPAWKLMSKSYTYDEVATGRIQVAALYTFQQE